MHQKVGNNSSIQNQKQNEAINDQILKDLEAQMKQLRFDDNQKNKELILFIAIFTLD